MNAPFNPPPAQPPPNSNVGKIVALLMCLALPVFLLFCILAITFLGKTSSSKFEAVDVGVTATTATELPVESDTRRVTTTTTSDAVIIAAFQSVTCDEYVEMCSMTDSQARELISDACDILDTVDPNGTMSEDAVFGRVAELAAEVADTRTQGLQIAYMVGAIYGVRTSACSLPR